MTNKPILITALAILCMFASGLMFHDFAMDQPLATHNVKIEKTNDGTWRVRDNNGKNKGSMEVSAGDRISWQAKGSSMIFIFSSEVDQYFEFDDGVFSNNKSQRIRRNRKLQVTVKEGAPIGELVYEVYVLSDDKTVIGNSPPKLIIR